MPNWLVVLGVLLIAPEAAEEEPLPRNLKTLNDQGWGLGRKLEKNNREWQSFFRLRETTYEQIFCPVKKSCQQEGIYACVYYAGCVRPKKPPVTPAPVPEASSLKVEYVKGTVKESKPVPNPETLAEVIATTDISEVKTATRVKVVSSDYGSIMQMMAFIRQEGLSSCQVTEDILLRLLKDSSIEVDDVLPTAVIRNTDDELFSCPLKEESKDCAAKVKEGREFKECLDLESCVYFFQDPEKVKVKVPPPCTLHKKAGS